MLSDLKNIIYGDSGGNKGLISNIYRVMSDVKAINSELSKINFGYLKKSHPARYTQKQPFFS